MSFPFPFSKREDGDVVSPDLEGIDAHEASVLGNTLRSPPETTPKGVGCV